MRNASSTVHGVAAMRLAVRKTMARIDHGEESKVDLEVKKKKNEKKEKKRNM